MGQMTISVGTISPGFSRGVLEVWSSGKSPDLTMPFRDDNGRQHGDKRHGHDDADGSG